jgi:PmbA protein
MIGEKEFREIQERVFEMSTADETEIILGGGLENLTRFGENRITQNVSEERYELRIRCRVGRRMGLATTNDFHEDGLRRCVDEAISLAGIQEESDRVIEFARGDQRSEDSAWARESCDLPASTRAEWVKIAVDMAKAEGVEVGGIALTSEGTIADYGEIEPFAVANTNGLFRFGKKTRAIFEVSAQKDDGAGRSRILARSAADVDPEAVASDAIERALASRNPVQVDPGSYTVVFEAEAVTDLLFFLTYMGVNGLALAEKRCPLGDKLGQKVLGDNITLLEDPGYPGLFGIGFDGEGIDTRSFPIVENGVLRSFLHDRLSAHLTGQEPTGNALPQPNGWGAFTRFPVLKGGDASLDELVAGVDRGLLVTRLWYINLVDPMNMTVTGMTRDGTFLIEGGKIVGPVKNFRFNQSLLNFFNSVEQLGKIEDLGNVALPSMRVKGFNFTSGTDF